MKVCLICTEIFSWGKYGGFGRVTRTIGKELVKREIEIFAVVPKQKGQKDLEILDGIKVLGFSKHNPFSAKSLIMKCDADIYHSEEPSFTTYLAMRTMPGKIHIITSRDPRNFTDWMVEFFYPSSNILQVISNFIYENNFLVSSAVRKASKVFYTAKFLEQKVNLKYHLKKTGGFLPTPIEIPRKKIIKSEQPLVCFIARMDRRKRPEIFFKLAKEFPGVKFVVAGKSRSNGYENFLRQKYSNLTNLEFAGFINQFETDKVSSILEKSWILVNPTIREGLPNSFLEALAHKCAVLSSVNPENVVQDFGYYVEHNDFIKGLRYLLENNNWKEKGEKGQKYVIENYELIKTIDKHVETYNKLLNNRVQPIPED
jgi:glycosyltransferase involved in cell wall biosynthesis